MSLIDLKEISHTGEDWEAFARDFLVELGFSIESPPDRGADGGKDLLVIENLRGHLNRYPFRWLVSCKHFAHSGRSVGENDEPNILDRVARFGADGFIGFYSTVPSSGLNDRLRALRDERRIRDYRIFDGALIENYCLRIGYSKILLRYCPQSYVRVKPLHLLVSEYIPLECEICGRDLLKELGPNTYNGNVVFFTDTKVDPEFVHDLYWVCKGKCDRKLESRYKSPSIISQWEDIGDLAIPTWYLKWVLAGLNRRQKGRTRFSDEAHEKYKTFLIAMGQKVFREMTEEERKRVGDLLTIDHL